MQNNNKTNPGLPGVLFKSCVSTTGFVFKNHRLMEQQKRKKQYATESGAGQRTTSWWKGAQNRVYDKALCKLVLVRQRCEN